MAMAANQMTKLAWWTSSTGDRQAWGPRRTTMPLANITTVSTTTNGPRSLRTVGGGPLRR